MRSELEPRNDKITFLFLYVAMFIADMLMTLAEIKRGDAITAHLHGDKRTKKVLS